MHWQYCRSLKFDCPEKPNKAKNLEETKAVKLDLPRKVYFLPKNQVFTFCGEEKKCLSFGQETERSRHKMVSIVILRNGPVPEEETR